MDGVFLKNVEKRFLSISNVVYCVDHSGSMIKDDEKIVVLTATVTGHERKWQPYQHRFERVPRRVSDSRGIGSPRPRPRPRPWMIGEISDTTWNYNGRGSF